MMQSYSLSEKNDKFHSVGSRKYLTGTKKNCKEIWEITIIKRNLGKDAVSMPSILSEVPESKTDGYWVKN